MHVYFIIFTTKIETLLLGFEVNFINLVKGWTTWWVIVQDFVQIVKLVLKYLLRSCDPDVFVIKGVT